MSMMGTIADIALTTVVHVIGLSLVILVIGLILILLERYATDKK